LSEKYLKKAKKANPENGFALIEKRYHKNFDYLKPVC